MKALFRICKSVCEKYIVNSDNMTEILLFFVIVSEMILKTQDMEKLVEKKDEMKEEERADEYRIESTMAEIEGLMTQLNQSGLIQQVLLYLIYQIPVTTHSSKSRVFLVFHNDRCSLQCPY